VPRRTTVARHESALGRWEMVRAAPHPALRGQVQAYCGYREETPAPLTRSETPSGTVALVLSFGDEISVSVGGAPPRRHTSFLAPLDHRPATTEHAGRQHGVEVKLCPTATRRLVGMPLHELPGAVVDLDLLLGRRADELVETLATAPTWEERFARLDAVLARRLADAPALHPGVQHAWRLLVATHGKVSVAALAAELGWSRRHLGERVRADLGLPPKVIARMLRFDRAKHLLGCDDGSGLAEIALDCGYYDQAHLNRDFREFADSTPSDFLARRLPDGGGVAGAGGAPSVAAAA
jgi:AraC-like DNA-binding protein